MSRPVLLAVDESENALRDIERELRDRYERHYRIVCLGSAPEAEAELERLADAGEEVALVFAGHSLGGTREPSCSAGRESTIRGHSAGS